jgi:hypothetical protein
LADVVSRSLHSGRQDSAVGRRGRLVALAAFRQHPLVVDEVAELPAVIVQPEPRRAILQGCQIFLGTTYKNGDKILAQNVLRSSKIDQNYLFQGLPK